MSMRCQTEMTAYCQVCAPQFSVLDRAAVLLDPGSMRGTLALVLLVACMNADKNPQPCLTAGLTNVADLLLRNPDTGQCQSFGPTCDPTCGPCPGFAEPDWAMCDGACDGLTEDQCLASQSCHAAYQDSPTPSPAFLACFELPPTGGITGGGCAGLDSQTCSEHTDCSSLYTSAVNAPPTFVPMFESC